MDNLSKHVADVYSRLMDTAVVKSGEVTGDSITELSRLLCELTPRDDYHRAVGDFIRFMCKRNYGPFLKYLVGVDLGHLILLGDGRCIANALGLRDVVHIKYGGDSWLITKAEPYKPRSSALRRDNRTRNRPRKKIIPREQKV